MGNVSVQNERKVNRDHRTHDPLVSVIVPVYKVEKHLKNCIDSILGQTYKNLQIILVDDGSPDSCGAICDDYANLDKRIKVMHQANQGLACARNTGLKIAQGEWIAWVDSDDWVESDFIEDMVSAALSNNADIVISGHYEEYKNRSEYCGVHKKIILDTKQAILMLLEDEVIKNYMWDKLWRSELFSEVRFPVGRAYEDKRVCYTLIIKAQKIICIPKAYYHYTNRSDSITNSDNIKNQLDCLLVTLERRSYLLQRYPEYKFLLEKDYIKVVIGLWGNSYKNGVLFNKSTQNRLEPVSKYYRTHVISKKSMADIGLAGHLIVKLVPYNKNWSYFIASLIGALYIVKNRKSM